MLYREIIAVCSEIHTKHTNKLCGQNVEFGLWGPRRFLLTAHRDSSPAIQRPGCETNFPHLLPWLKMSGILLLLPLTCLHETERDVAFLSAVRKIAKSHSQLRHVSPVSPSVWKNPATNWTDFHEIWQWSIFRKSVEKIKVSLKSDNSNRHFTWRPINIFYQISLSSS
jgi:hypothetical protein